MIRRCAAPARISSSTPAREYSTFRWLFEPLDGLIMNDLARLRTSSPARRCAIVIIR
jgi:hypothetical protein